METMINKEDHGDSLLNSEQEITDGDNHHNSKEDGDNPLHSNKEDGDNHLHNNKEDGDSRNKETLGTLDR